MKRTSKLPSSDEEGWLRHKMNIAKLPLIGAAGVVLIKKIKRWLNQPPRPRQKRSLRTIFIDGAATPPYPRRGVRTALCILLIPVVARAEILDRIVAVVDSHIITMSDMRQEREILMRLGEKPIDDDKALVQHMVDNYLIETGIQDFPGVDITDADVDAELKNSVAVEGAPSQAVREAVRLRLRMRRYFDMRFRQYIRVSDDDVRKYYDDVFMPAARERRIDPIPSLGQVSDLIRNNIVQERLNHEIDIWLEAIHRRSNIEIFE